MINVYLNGFVLFIALLHLELFRWSNILTTSIRNFAADKIKKENVFANDGNKLKELFEPFTETATWSKAFAMLLAINIYTWRASGVSGGVEVDENSWFFRLIFSLYIVIVLWIVSLPRYRIQYELFKLRKSEGVHEYFDIRMPWTIGWSVFIDLLLITFFTTVIFGRPSEIFNLFLSLFPS